LRRIFHVCEKFIFAEAHLGNFYSPVAREKKFPFSLLLMSLELARITIPLRRSPQAADKKHVSHNSSPTPQMTCEPTTAWQYMCISKEQVHCSWLRDESFCWSGTALTVPDRPFFPQEEIPE
jgi:hypothetical protein